MLTHVRNELYEARSKNFINISAFSICCQRKSMVNLDVVEIPTLEAIRVKAGRSC